MFYSQYILAKRGPLGTIWIAAHLDRKLRKNQIAETDIVSSVSTDSEFNSNRGREPTGRERLVGRRARERESEERANAMTDAWCDV